MTALEKFQSEQIRTNLFIEDKMSTQKWEGIFSQKLVYYYRVRLTNGHVIKGSGDSKEKAMEDCINKIYSYLKSCGTFRNAANVAAYK